MKWEYCENCYINGHCENQDRGRECELYGKRMKDKCEKLEKQLKIAIDVLEVISTHTCFWDEDTKEQVSTVYAWSSKALEQIEELDK